MATVKRPLPKQNMVVNKDTDSNVPLQREFSIEERNQRLNQTEMFISPNVRGVSYMVCKLL